MIFGSIYLFTFGLMLFNGGAFLDDWVIVNQENAVRLVMQQEIGFFGYWPAYVHNVLLSLPAAIFWERVVIFISYLLAGVLLHGILKSVREIDGESRFWVVVFFLLFPVNFVRTCISNINYALSYLMFFLGFWLLVKFRECRGPALRLASLLCLFLSFSTNSMLVFYGVIIAYTAYAELAEHASVSKLIKRAGAYADYALLPVIFWIIKNLAFPPGGLYADYNAITGQKAIAAFFQLPACVHNAILEPIRLSVGQGNIVVVIALAGALYLALKHARMPHADISVKGNIVFAGVGVILFVMAVFPYLAVGKMPSLWDAESRHQLLVPLGAAFMLYFGLKIALLELEVPQKWRTLMYSVIAAFFMWNHVAILLDFQQDHYKQLSLIEQFRASAVVRDNHAFLFVDAVPGLNALQRKYRFYEYTGMMKVAFGDDTRLGVEKGFESDRPEEYRMFVPYRQYNISGYALQPFSHVVTIEQGAFHISRSSALRLMALRVLSPDQYARDIQNIVNLTIADAGYQS